MKAADTHQLFLLVGKGLALAFLLEMNIIQEHLMPTAQKIYAVSVKNEGFITTMFMKCSWLYVFSEAMWGNSWEPHIWVLPLLPQTMSKSIHTDFLTVYFSDWVSRMRKCSVPQRQVDHVFWRVFSNYCLAYMIFFVMYACMKKNLEQTCSLKKPHTIKLFKSNFNAV